jgi:hypothetical protein
VVLSILDIIRLNYNSKLNECTMCEYFTQMVYLAVHRLTRSVHNIIILNTVISSSSIPFEAKHWMFHERVWLRGRRCDIELVSSTLDLDNETILVPISW